jgi:heterodisulfide reductase subunit B
MGEEDYPGQYDILEDPKVKIVHDLDFLHLIRYQVLKSIKFDLKGLKVASHYGCHYLNLDRDKDVHTYLKDKRKLEDLIELFGGQPVDYMEREGCCGWGASQVVLHPEEAFKITYKKLKSAENGDADFLLMPCPTCLYTLSKPEFRDKINELFQERLDIPTIHINELMSILRGCEEERCVALRKNNPRIHEIYEIITEQE